MLPNEGFQKIPLWDYIISMEQGIKGQTILVCLRLRCLLEHGSISVKARKVQANVRQSSTLRSVLCHNYIVS
jgi:hypothetical protein